jgi:hypothetical protein
VVAVKDVAPPSEELVTEPMPYVFLPQELQAVFPSLVRVDDTCDGGEGKLSIDYISMVPILTAAIQEQQTIITAQKAEINEHGVSINLLQEENQQLQKEIGILQEVVFGQELDLTTLYALKKEVQELRKIVFMCCSDVSITRQDTTSFFPNNNNNMPNVGAVLYQNTPNPFTSNTEISCDIPAINHSAFIYVYNLQGVELMSFPIVQTGFSTVTIYASALPAGMYLYTLVIDNQIIDTKRMILTK